MSSVYTNTPYANIPHDANYPYGFPYLNGRLPDVHFPWDAVYDVQYQHDVRNPKYQYYGNMSYPYFVRRHRIPSVLANPKPTEVEHGDYSYQIPQYPPYVYWYPNPVECRDTCGEQMCGAWAKRMNDYRMCQMCQNLKSPQCWDAARQRCTPCRPEQALARCEDRFGCANPNGWMQDRVAPINPKYTGCRLCN